VPLDAHAAAVDGVAAIERARLASGYRRWPDRPVEAAPVPVRAALRALAWTASSLGETPAEDAACAAREAARALATTTDPDRARAAVRAAIEEALLP
jgi:hypothetical protein